MAETADSVDVDYLTQLAQTQGANANDNAPANLQRGTPIGDAAYSALGGATGAIGDMQSSIARQRALGDQREAATAPMRNQALQTLQQPHPAQPNIQPQKDASGMRQLTADQAKEGQLWISAISLVSALAGAHARQGSTAALSAFAGGMKGLKEGNQQAFDNNYKIWTEENKAILENNNAEIEKYKTILEDRKLTEAEQLQQIALVASPMDNKLMLEAALSGDLSKVAAGYTQLFKANEGLQKIVDKREEKSGDAAAKFDFSNAAPTEVVPGTGLTVQAIEKLGDAVGRDGLLPSQAGLGYGMNPVKKAVDNYVGWKYPDSTYAQSQLEFYGKKREIGTVDAAAGRIELAANSLDRMIPVAKKYLAQADVSNFPDINSLEGYVSTHRGEARYTNLNAALQAIISDHAALMVRGGPPTVESRTAAREMASKYMGKGQLEGYFDVVEAEKQAQKDAITDTQGEVTGKKVPVPTPPAGAPAGGDVDYHARYGLEK